MLNFKEVPFDCNDVQPRSKWFSSLSHLVRVSGVTRTYRTVHPRRVRERVSAGPRAAIRHGPGPARPGTDEDVRTWAGLEAVAKKVYC